MTIKKLKAFETKKEQASYLEELIQDEMNTLDNEEAKEIKKKLSQ